MDEPGWNGDGQEPEAQVSTNDVLEKEAVIKDIIGLQQSLKALLERVQTVRTEREKLKKDNQTLQTYIDNLTRSNALAAANQK